MKRRPRHAKNVSAFTLVEVMITMFLISMMCLSVFAGLQQITKSAMAVAARDEAYHLLQDKAEDLLAGTYSTFVPTTTDETITGCLKTTYQPSTDKPLTYPSGNGSGRPTYTRRVVQVASSTNSSTLRVEVQWTFNSTPNLISVVLYRTDSN